MEYKHLLPADIERTSMKIIEEEMVERGIEISEEDMPVVRRVIHTSADFDYGKNLEFTENDGTTRAVASVSYASEKYPNAVFAVGNAPTALIKLSELIRDGFRPSLVIGVPVGFVNVVESKEEIFELCREKGIPAIVAKGRKGGSNVAAAICNALLYAAGDLTDPSKRGWRG